MQRPHTINAVFGIVIVLAIMRITFAVDPFESMLKPIITPVSRAILQIQNPLIADEQQIMEGQREALKRENEALRQQLSFNDENMYEAAEVVRIDMSSYRKSIIINKGSEHGIRVGDPVLRNGFLFGRVEHIFKTQSEIRVITDPEFSVTAQYNDLHGVLQNSYGSLLFDLVPRGDVSQGSTITTDGIDGLFRPGIPIAFVDNNITQAGKVFFTYNTLLPDNPITVRYVQVEKR